MHCSNIGARQAQPHTPSCIWTEGDIKRAHACTALHSVSYVLVEGESTSLHLRAPAASTTAVAMLQAKASHYPPPPYYLLNSITPPYLPHARLWGEEIFHAEWYMSNTASLCKPEFKVTYRLHAKHRKQALMYCFHIITLGRRLYVMPCTHV